LVERDDAAKSAGLIALEGGLIRPHKARSLADPAGVGVFHDHASRAIFRIEFGHQFHGRIGVIDIVVGEFFALMLHGGGDAGTRLSVGVERCGLVGIFAITQRLRQCACNRFAPGGDIQSLGQPI